MPTRFTSAVIIIGNEILSGRTRDSNLSFLGKRLEEQGIYLCEARIIPDDEDIIIKTVNELRRRHDYIFTTGGIGPTHDDITAAAIAKAFDVALEKNPEALNCLKQYYGADNVNEARMKMANIPAGADLILNPASGAPGFRVDNVFVMAGIPSVMQLMFDGIADHLTGGPPILSKSITTDLRESQLADGLGKLQEQYEAVSIGSYPFFNEEKTGVNVIIRSTNADELAIIADGVERLIDKLGGRIIATA